MRQRRIFDTYKESETTAEASAAQRRAQWIGNNNGVSNFLAIVSQTVTLSRLCLVAVSFWYCFHQVHFPPIHFKKYYQYCNHVENIFVPSVN